MPTGSTKALESPLSTWVRNGTRLLRFEDSKVTNGPDLHVVLSPYEDPDEKGVKCRKADLEKMQTLHNQCGIV